MENWKRLLNGMKMIMLGALMLLGIAASVGSIAHGRAEEPFYVLAGIANFLDIALLIYYVVRTKTKR